jgi:hypothetical protein
MVWQDVMPCNKLDTEQLLRTKGICKNKIKEKKNSITTVMLKTEKHSFYFVL